MAAWSTLVKAAQLDFGIQWVGWAIASLLKTEKFYDLAGSATFISLCIQSFPGRKNSDKEVHPRQSITTFAVIIWAFRLGGFLFRRIIRDGHDKRFNGVRDKPLKFLMYWTIQGLWVFMTLLPVLILNSKKKHENPDLTWRDYLGWSIWAFGLTLEATADYQKWSFRAKPENQNKFITTGVWSSSRHPNYLGEILLWLGIWLPCSSTFKGLENASVISPLFVAFLLTKVSGIPLLEAASKKKWRNNEKYLEYIKKTAVLIPGIW